MSASIPALCVLPLSTPYAHLSRAHLYFVSLALFLPLRKGWLFRAAVAAFTTKTSVFAIDAIVHLAHLKRHARDENFAAPLDAIVALEMLSLASIVAAWLLVVSRTASLSAARGLVKFWAVSVSVACVVAFVGVRMLATGEFATFDLLEDGGGGVCPEGAVLMPVEDVLGPVEDLSIGTYPARIGRFVVGQVGVTGLLFSALTFCCIGATGPGSKISSASRFKLWDVEQDSSPEIAQAQPGSLFRRWYGLVRYTVGMVLIGVFIFVVVTAENYLLDMVPDIPQAEPLTSVGQWGIWAATGVVILGTFVNAVKQKERDRVGGGGVGTTALEQTELGTDNTVIGVPEKVYA